MSECEEIDNFFCVYLIAALKDGEAGFHVGICCASCEHCLSGILASYDGEILYKKRFSYPPPWRKVMSLVRKAGDDWLRTHGIDEVSYYGHR